MKRITMTLQKQHSKNVSQLAPYRPKKKVLPSAIIRHSWWLLISGTLLWTGTIFTDACVLSCLVMSNSLQPLGLQPTRLLCPWDFSGKNIGVGFISFSRGPSKPRDWTHISLLQMDSSPLKHWGSLIFMGNFYHS